MLTLRLVSRRAVLLCVLVAAWPVPEVQATVTAAIKASRVACVSPCTVVFSAENSADTALVDPHLALSDLGYHFDFDDEASGNYSTTSLPKQRQLGGALAAHTFVCSSTSTKLVDGRQCAYEVGVRVQNAAGDIADAFVGVTVRESSAYYGAANTICVSNSGAFDGDIPCPAGAVRTNALPAVGGYSGKRVLLRRGESFAGPICTSYLERDVLIESFGNAIDRKPEVIAGVQVGVDTKCGDRVPDSDAEIASYGKSWSENVTVNNIRTSAVSLGMSYTHVTLHALDMDYKEQPSGGQISLNSNSQACVGSASIACSNVPYPIGAYISDTKIVGSDTALPLVNVAGFRCPLINYLAFIGNDVGNADEHNMRTEGTWRGVWAHNKMRGYHHNSGKKHTITIRNCGYGDIDPGVALFRQNAQQSTVAAPRTGYSVVADNILGSVDSTQASWKLHIGPTNDGSTEAGWDAVVERNIFIDSIVSPSIDMALRGKYLVARSNNKFSPDQQGCTDLGPGAIPEGYYSPARCKSPDVPRPERPNRTASLSSPPSPVTLQVN